jgi:hypothetical protein
MSYRSTFAFLLVRATADVLPKQNCMLRNPTAYIVTLHCVAV